MPFTVSVPATDRALISLADLKAVLGISDAVQDIALSAFALKISDMIAEECRVPSSGVAVPTLRQETIVERFRLDGHRVNPLILARRFVSSITSVVEDGVTLATADYEFEGASGLMTRLDTSGGVVCWDAKLITVTYVAGFATVPPALAAAAEYIAREQWSLRDPERDPLLKSEQIKDWRNDYWVGGLSGSSGSSAFSASAAAMLANYRYYPV